MSNDAVRRLRASTYSHRPLPVPQKKRHSSTNIPPSKQQMSYFPAASPTLYPQEQVDPLSLQDSTFLYILSNINLYPISILSQLPLAWRRKLFSALPPFRLYELEKTPIADGIDTDMIWKDLSELQNSIWAIYVKDRRSTEFCLKQSPSSPFSPTWSKSPHLDQPCPREQFIDYLSHLFFNEMNRDYACKRITELLHAIHVDRLEPSVAAALMYGHINSLFMFIPSYSLLPFRCPNLTEREIYCCLNSNRMKPKSLEIYPLNLDASPLWSQDIIGQELMRRMFCNLEFLRIFNHKHITEQLEQVMQAVTKSSVYKEPPSSMGSLRHLELLKTDDYHIAAITPYFRTPKGYSHLTRLTISMKPLQYLDTTTHLEALIRHQLNNLQHLHLQGYSCCNTSTTIDTRDYTFFKMLASFVFQHRFRNLVISNFREMPWKLLEMLLEANLRTVPSHKQSLIFKDGKVVRSGLLPFSITKEDADDTDDEEGHEFLPAAESKCLDHKCIHFENVSLPIDVLEWFEKIDRLCVNTLEFNKVIVIPASSLPNLANFKMGKGGVEYKRVIQEKKDNESLKNIFVNHTDFDCRVFQWAEVNLKLNI